MTPGSSQFIEGESPSPIDLMKRMGAKNLKVAMMQELRLLGASWFLATCSANPGT